MKKYYFLLIVLLSITAVKAQVINFPDANFKALLLQSDTTNDIAQIFNRSQPGEYINIRIDTNNNGEIEVSEAANVEILHISGVNITSLVGINSFANLEILTCNNTQVSNIELSNLDKINGIGLLNHQSTSLSIVGQSLGTLSDYVSIDCSNSSVLSNLQISGVQVRGMISSTNNNQLTSLTLTNLPNISELYCNNNQLTSLTFSGVGLGILDCSNNQLTNLDFHGTSLASINCSNNLLTNLDVSFLRGLMDLVIDNNLIETIEVNNAPYFNYFKANNNNNLTSVFLKAGCDQPIFLMEFVNNPNLRYICVDDLNIDFVQQKITEYSYTNCHVNSYCSFTPGGEFYTINGNTKLDFDNNGCDVADVNYPNLKFNITNGTTNGTMISNSLGNYSISVPAGTYTVTPILENPTYFTISPSSINVTFPGQSSPLTQNFCMVPILTPDLEINILPIVPPRPGFTTSFRIIYKNKGNVTQSGTVNFSFDDSVLDFVYANAAITSQTLNNLSWDFSNLQPLETREIFLVLHVNSPMQTPAVNAGDVLGYSTSIISAATDETPADNTFTLSQTVVNSFDPNDKTCLEGTTIAPSEVGKYVHYLIRFENTGTYPAENIVVKDIIDTNKFDISSLVPIDGSHEFTTRINDNKVEFIFENINLPFDDANNDGYVAFKIKTKPTLVNGDTFSNSASIYFDYNFPIVTNTATTTIAALSTQDFEFGQYFSLYPNPVSNVLNIETKQTIQVSSINIYNTLGQLVMVVPNAEQISKVDVSNLSSGNYFIKINSDKGASNTKFIKR
ncbi:T9SS type A sorting domain-containing protein [Flavobacterium enshiense]|uniref:T9SS type A sorting domain-containing protein n=1 Tax=Flavobacterium enshiense TaxID=1341165 RepID=UPI00345DD7C2